jgi:argininosuccinate lyase
MGPPDATSLWGGRFESELDPVILGFTGSLPFDARLVRHDLIASLAHARMLLETGIVSRTQAEPILNGLSEMLKEIEKGALVVEGPDEDVHSWIERTLRARIGSAAGRLHTARSRNDQVSVALRLWVREELVALCALLSGLLETWLGQATEHIESWMPGYTHLQRAQPVSLAHHLLAHFWALEADAERLRTAYVRAGSSPLGSGALAGSRHPIDPHRSAALLGLPEVCPNSLLAVADRDFVAEATFACALLMVHMSRWAEEVILWTSLEFGFAALSDTVAQGSSLMPQKKNPESGDLTGLLATLKGLPFAYNSDLQEDKEPLFDALDTASGSVGAATQISRGLMFNVERMLSALDTGYLTATDLADLLVERGTPFREAHAAAGATVREAEARGCELWELDPDDLSGTGVVLDAELLREIRPEAAGAARLSHGGPSPERVGEQLAEAAKALERLRRWAEEGSPPPIYRSHLAGRLLEEEIA